MLFCVAGAALCDIPTCLITRRKSFCCACHTFASFSQDELQFSWQAHHFGDLCRHFAWHFRCVALRPLRSTLRTLLPTLHSTLHTPNSRLDTLDSTLHTLHSKLYTPYFTLHTLHSTLYTLHFTLYTPYFTLQTLHSTLCTPPFSIFHSLRRTGMVTGENIQDCSNNCFRQVLCVTVFPCVSTSVPLT